MRAGVAAHVLGGASITAGTPGVEAILLLYPEDGHSYLAVEMESLYKYTSLATAGRYQVPEHDPFVCVIPRSVCWWSSVSRGTRGIESVSCPQQASVIKLLCLHLRVGPGSRHEPPQAQIIHDILDSLDVVLDRVAALPQNVVLEVEQLEAGKQVLDKGRNGQRQGKVAVRDGVGGEARQVLREVRQGEEVLLDGEVEGVAVLEVRGDCRFLSAACLPVLLFISLFFCFLRLESERGEGGCWV